MVVVVDMLVLDGAWQLNPQDLLAAEQVHVLEPLHALEQHL